MHGYTHHTLLAMSLLALAGCTAAPGEAPGSAATTATGSAAAPAPAAATTAGQRCADAPAPAIDAIAGTYVVRSAARYRGGLTSEAEAQAQVGRDMRVTPAEFRIGTTASTSPRYAIACHDLAGEGEVPGPEQRLLGPFNGIGVERDVVWTLDVEDGAGALLASFEIVRAGDGIALWRLHDGWVYVLDRADAAPATQ